MPCSVARRAGSCAILLFAVALPAPPMFASTPARERGSSAVMTVEHRWLAALQRRDVRTLARILGQEFIDSSFRGEAITRAQYLAYFAHPAARPMPRVRQTFADTAVRFVAGGDVAIVTGVLITRSASTSDAATSTDRDAVRHSRFTDVFVWRDGRWQAVTAQETHF